MSAAFSTSVDQLAVNIDNVRLAISHLYSPSSSASHNTISQWLTSVKKSPRAWELMWLLLMPDKTDMERFLGATFLRDKLREQWQEIPADDLPLLKSRVLETTLLEHSKPSAVTGPLVEALATLLVQTCSDVWPDVIGELTRSCQSMVDQHLGARILLAVLAETPQQMIKCYVSSDKRSSIKQKLIGHTPQVLELVLTVLKQSPSEPVASRCMELLASWVELDLMASDVLSVLDLVLVPFVGSPSLVGVTLDMLDRVVSSPVNYNYPMAVMQLAERVLTLQPFIKKFIDDNEPETLVTLGNVFTGLMASHSRTFVSALVGGDIGHADVSRRIIAAILELSSVPGRYPCDETVSELTFGVWYTIQDDILASDEHRAALTEQLQPVYFQLLNVMVQKSMLPLDQSEMSADERESFRRYRQDILDFYTYTQSLLGNYILDSFIVYMHGAIQAVRGEPSRWPALEAVLHGLAGLGEVCTEDSDDLSAANSMRTVLLTLPEIPYSNNKQLMEAALKLIDACSPTFDLHPDCLTRLMPMLVAGLQDTQVALYSTMALKDICQEAPLAVAPHATLLLPVCKDVLLSGRVSSRESVRLMYVVGALLLHITDDTQRHACLQAVVLPFIQSFKDQLNTAQSSSSCPSLPAGGNKNQLVTRVHMFASLASAMALDRDDTSDAAAADARLQPLTALLGELLPALHQLASLHAQDEDVAECVCSLLNRTMLALGEMMEPFLKGCLDVLSVLYSKEPHPQVLDLIKQMLTLRREGVCGTIMRSTIDQVCAASLSYFSSDPVQFPESLVRFLEMMSQTMKKNAAYLTDLQAHIPALFSLGSNSICQQDRRVMKSACSFMCQFVEKSAELPVLRLHLHERGAHLVSAILLAIASTAARDSVEFTADVLLSLSRVCVDRLSGWLALLLAQPAYPSEKVTAHQKKLFAKHVLQSRNNKTFLRSQVSVFFKQCRGFCGTEHIPLTLNTSSAGDQNR